MCHFITLIAPTDDAATLSAVMAKYGRAAKPLDNPSIRGVLREGESQYLTTRAYCDCGTVLSAQREAAEITENRIADQEARLRRKGWSRTKIARAMDDRRKADTKPKATDLDSFELWEEVLAAVRDELGLSYVGLFLRFYSGSVESDAFDASRRDVPKADAVRDALSTMRENEVTIFR